MRAGKKKQSLQTCETLDFITWHALPKQDHSNLALDPVGEGRVACTVTGQK